VTNWTFSDAMALGPVGLRRPQQGELDANGATLVARVFGFSYFFLKKIIYFAVHAPDPNR
jgi:hypothetical protein